MRRYFIDAVVMAAVLATAACVGGGTSGGGSSGGSSTTDGGSGGSDSGGAGGGGSGDNTKNTAAVTTSGDDGKKSEVKVDKPATKADAEAKTNATGATNAGKVLHLWITSVGSDGSKVISIVIDTAKHKLPVKGLAVGTPPGDVYVSYTLAGAAATGSYSSTGKGTVDIDTCPTAQNQAVVGRFNGVELKGDAVVGGPKGMTLDGPFNLVYFGGAGALECKPAEVKPDVTSGGDGGSVNTGSLKPPSGSTCNADPCDGGKNLTRNCCPYVPCVEPCMVACSSAVGACVQGCAADPMNMEKCALECVAKVTACNNGCLTKCEVSATCKSAAEAYNKCADAAFKTCGSGASDSCIFDKCCSELKAAF